MSKLRSYDGMRESDALLAIDGEGKWVERVEAEREIARLIEERDALRKALEHIRQQQVWASRKSGKACAKQMVRIAERALATEADKEAGA